jgi:hypothetical protein
LFESIDPLREPTPRAKAPGDFFSSRAALTHFCAASRRHPSQAPIARTHSQRIANRRK